MAVLGKATTTACHAAGYTDLESQANGATWSRRRVLAPKL
jgi:hypothetical protein